MFKVGEVDLIVAGVNVGSGERRKDFRIIEKLEDLEGMENSWGLYLSIKPYIENGEHTEVLAVMSRGVEVCVTSFDLYNNNNIERDIEVMRSMGFEIRYKPLRTKEEVIKDMERQACEKSDNCKTMVFWDKLAKDYAATDDVRSPMNIKAYFTGDVANDFVAELREILKNNK